MATNSVVAYPSIAGTNDPTNITLDAVPTTNGTWAKFSAALATTQATALADAGYIETVMIVSGVKKTYRIPAFLVDA